MIATLLFSLTTSAYDFEVDGIYYNIISKADLTTEVTRGDTYYSGSIALPTTVNYEGVEYSVTSIGEDAFSGCWDLTTITIPESITNIGDWAFGSCSSLTSVHIRNIEAWCYISFESPTANPLHYAHNLYLNGELVTELVIPSGVTSIGDHAFYDCRSLTSIVLPEGVTSIGGSAFSGCSSLTAINIPASMTSIGNSAFGGCSSLTAITIPEGVTNIGEQVFDYCSSLSFINVADGNPIYDSRERCNAIIATGSNTLIRGCSATIIPKSVESIGNYAFRGCSSLTFITLPEGVTSIGEDAFSSCSSLTSITLPASVTSIGDFAFFDCRCLYKVINNSNLSLSIGSSSNGRVAYYAKVIYKGSELTTVDDFQFYTSDDIHSLVNYIGNEKEIVLTDSYNGGNYKIGDYAFSGFSSLTSITLPGSVTSIGNYAFYNSTALKKFIIEDGSTTLLLGSNGSSEGLFYDCPLEEVYLGRNLSYNVGSSYGYSPFYNKDALTKVAIGNEVTEIGQYAFYGCDNIYSLTIPNGILTIGSSAFSTPDKVIWLTNTPPTGYTNAKGNINYVANNQYAALSNVQVYPYLSSMFEVDGVRYVPVNPSERTCHAIDCVYDETIETISVGETASFRGIEMKVMEMMPYTFCGNKNIKEVSVSHLGNIGDYAFYDCDSIQHAELSNHGDIGNQAFCNCDGIKDVKISNLGNIGSQAFYNCDAIETVTISNQGIIGGQTFYDCNGIKNVDIHNRGSIGNQAFYGCNGMETAIVANKGTVDSEAFSGCSALKTVILGDSIGSLGDKAFYQCSSLQEIVIPDSVKSVGSYCFWGCSALTNFSLGCSVATINNYVFQDCSSLSKIILPPTVTKVGDYVFAGCSKLADVIIADRSTALHLGSNGSSALFADCPLDSVYIGGKITYNTTSSKGYSPFYHNTSLRTIVVSDCEEQIYDNEFYGCTNLQNVTIGNGAKSIGNGAFRECTRLEEIVIPDSVKSVGSYCFYGCTAMKNVVIGDRLTDVKEYAFANCSGLESVRIGSGVTSISNHSFKDCSSISEIILPQSVTKVGDYVFSGCSLLASVIIADRTTALNLGSNGSSALFADCPLDSVYIGGKITYNTTSSKGYSPFYRNTSLRTVVITDREEQIYDNEFYGCTNLQDVTIGNGVKSIGDYAFSGCSSLEGFAFGSNMESIGAEAFSDCTGLTTITSHATVPPTCGAQALDDINKWSCTLRVPSGYAATYQAADQWKDFFFIEDAVEVAKYTLTFMVDGEVYHTESLAHKAEVTIPEVPTKEGHTFSGWSEVPETMPAEDVTVNGFFTVNKYLVTFKIGDEVISSESLEYGATIVAPEAPEREGYTFDGWGEVAETIPAGDVTYEGTYTVNVYKVYYYVGEELVHTAEVAYGESIPEYVYETTVEGDEFVGWIGEIYETMPAHDVTYTANITNDISRSTMGDSQLTIYDLNGRKIEVDDLRELAKGIYIVNGRLVVIK